MDTVDANTLFPATDWTVVLQVRAAGDGQAARQAMTKLCVRYWYPLYAFARRCGLGPHDAEDLTQDFFAQIVETNLFATAEPELGRLRTFLIVAFKRHLNRVKVRDRAQKRGGGQELVSIDAVSGEERYSHEPADNRTPEKIFERSWAMTVLQSAIQQIALEEAEAGRGSAFREFEPFLSPGMATSGSYAAPAFRLGMTVAAFRQGLSRFRRRFRLRLRRQIAATLRDPDEARVDEELAALRAALHG